MLPLFSRGYLADIVQPSNSAREFDEGKCRWNALFAQGLLVGVPDGLNPAERVMVEYVYSACVFPQVERHSADHSPSAVTTCPIGLSCSLRISPARNKSVRRARRWMEAFRLVDQLGTNDGLGENQLNGSKRIASIAIKHGKECQVFLGWRKTFLFDGQHAGLRQPG